ncbi:MAG: hypothetical protein MJ231_04055 [bacterium]|nr:hypothetical protein [bacterium]
MYELKYSYKYKIELQSEQEYYLRIYYKNMQIVWTLQEYTQLDINSILKEIQPKSKSIKYYPSLKIFVCKTKKDLNLIFRYLYSAYFEYKNTPSINLIEQSLKNFVSNSDEWNFYD